VTVKGGTPDKSGVPDVLVMRYGLSKQSLAVSVVLGDRALSRWIYEAVYDVYRKAIEV